MLRDEILIAKIIENERMLSQEVLFGRRQMESLLRFEIKKAQVFHFVQFGTDFLVNLQVGIQTEFVNDDHLFLYLVQAIFYY